MTEAEIETTRAEAAVRPGARRKKSPMKPAAVMLNDGERKTLDAVAEELGRSRSDLIREAVRRVWLKKGETKAGRR